MRSFIVMLSQRRMVTRGRGGGGIYKVCNLIAKTVKIAVINRYLIIRKKSTTAYLGCSGWLGWRLGVGDSRG